ncbi:hypothetical protein [Roseomonas sp. WA12]
MLRRALPVLGMLSLAACVAPDPQYGMAPQYVGIPQRCDTSFTVVNASSTTVQELYFSHASLRGWGNDQLGRNVLPPGRSNSYRASNQGAYDFRVVWTDGRAAELRNIDVCVASTITVTRSGLRAS